MTVLKPRRGPSLRLKLLGLTAAAVALALGTAALLTLLQTRRAFDRFVAEGDAAEARRLGDIVTFVYHQGGGLPAVLPLVRHLDEAQGLRLELRVSAGTAAGGHVAARGSEDVAALPTALATSLAAAAAGQLDPSALEGLLPPGAVLEIAPAAAASEALVMGHGGQPAPVAKTWAWRLPRIITQTQEAAVGLARREGAAIAVLKVGGGPATPAGAPPLPRKRWWPRASPSPSHPPSPRRPPRRPWSSWSPKPAFWAASATLSWGQPCSPVGWPWPWGPGWRGAC